MHDHGGRCQPLVRVNYFTGQVLSADDLQAEQDYARELHRRHNRACHGWGIVEGLSVAIGPGRQLLVEPGLALSLRGDEICVPDRVTVELEPLAAESAVAYIAIRGTETKTRPVPVTDPADTSAEQWSRIEESFEVAVLDALPIAHDRRDGDRSRLRVLRQSVLNRFSELWRGHRRDGHRHAAAADDTPEDDWVVLAKVARKRVSSGGEHLRLLAGVRRELR